MLETSHVCSQVSYAGRDTCTPCARHGSSSLPSSLFAPPRVPFTSATLPSHNIPPPAPPPVPLVVVPPGSECSGVSNEDTAIGDVCQDKGTTSYEREKENLPTTTKRVWFLVVYYIFIRFLIMFPNLCQHQWYINVDHNDVQRRFVKMEWWFSSVVSATGRDSLEFEPWVSIPVAAFSQTFFSPHEHLYSHYL